MRALKERRPNPQDDERAGGVSPLSVRSQKISCQFGHGTYNALSCLIPFADVMIGEAGMGSRRRGSGRRKVGRKKRRMRSKIRHRKG